MSESVCKRIHDERPDKLIDIREQVAGLKCSGEVTLVIRCGQSDTFSFDQLLPMLLFLLLLLCAL